MADLTAVLNSIKKNIKNNTEGRITGNLMQDQLIQIVNSLNAVKLDSTGDIPGLETDDKTIIGAINEINKKTGGNANIEIVPQRPAEGLPDTIYIVRKTDSASGNNYDEFIWVDGKWEIFGGNTDLEKLSDDEIKGITIL